MNKLQFDELRALLVGIAGAEDRLGKELRAEMGSLGKELCTEMSTLGKELRAEMGSLRQEMVASNTAIRTEMQAGFAGVATSIENLSDMIDEQHKDHEQRITQLEKTTARLRAAH